MLKILETIKAKLEALEAKGIEEVRELIEHTEEAIGIHKAQTGGGTAAADTGADKGAAPNGDATTTTATATGTSADAAGAAAGATAA